MIFPSFPPAQLLFEFVRIPQTTLSFWGIPVSTLVTLITNGSFWLLVAAAVFGIARFVRDPGPLPPMPEAPRLFAPPPENSLLVSGASKIPPVLTIPTTAAYPKTRRKSAQIITGAVFLPIRFSRKPIEEKIDVQTIEGIGPIYGGLLRNSGIDNVSKLLRMGCTERGRQRIADEVGVTSGTVLRWVHRGDLLRVKGIGSKYSWLLESAGINTVTDLSRQNPNYLCQCLKVFNRERNLVRRSPCSKTLGLWVHYARNLEPKLVE